MKGRGHHPHAERDVVFETPWFDVVTRPAIDGRAYYMLELDDYVSVVALTPDRQMVLVRQYRPVVGADTLELPSGHVEAGETPEQAARKELLEETGMTAPVFELLGALVPDVGRLTNRMWCFFAADAVQVAAPTDTGEGISVVTVPEHEGIALARDGKLGHALNLSVLFLAACQKKVTLS